VSDSSPFASNTGPLIALAKADLLSVLQQVAGTVSVPRAVHRELLAKRGPEAVRLDDALASFLRVVELPASAETPQNLGGLGEGERQAIMLASHQV
jgi:predicted nucleic acid-binding protein